MGKNVMTIGLYRKIMSIVEDIIGEKAMGLYIDEDVVYGYVSPEESSIVTNFDEQTCFFLDDMETDEIDVNMGITKLVIIPKNFSYVIKIPFTGVYASIYKMENSLFYRTFISGADGDICAEENSIYEEVSKLGASLLEPNIFVGLYNDCLPIYIQKKVDTIALDDSIIFQDDRVVIEGICGKTGSKIVDYLYREKGETFLPKSYLAIMIRTYGIQTTCKIYKEFKPLISDLHKGNYGRRKDGSIALFDYGGYDSSRWSKDF